MAQLRKEFITQPTAMASYDYADIASGLGYIIFYATTSRVADTLNYDLPTTAAEPGNSAAALLHERYSYIDSEITFATSTFNLPRIMEGDIYCNFTVGTSTTGGAVAITVKVYKNTTQIGTTTWTCGSANSNTTANVKINVSKTLLKVGDQLKVSWDSADTKERLMHDPLNRDRAVYDGGHGSWDAVTAATNPTKAEVHVPFRIDL